MILRHQRAVVCLCFILSGYLIQVNAHICEVGREKDRYNEWKWVLPYPDLCQCTSVIMGGMNTWTPIRPFAPKYYDSPLLSDDVDEIRGYLGIHCDDGNAAKTSTKAPSTSVASTRRYRTRVSSLSTTDVIDAASTSTESPSSSPVATSRYRTRVSSVSTADAIGQSTEYVPTATGTTAIVTDTASKPGTDTTGTAVKVSSRAPPVCDDFLGMENDEIPNERITASSEFLLKIKNVLKFYAWEARLNGISCWRAYYNDTDKPWIQADIGYQTYVSGIMIQGDGGNIGPEDWVKTLNVSFYKNTDDTEVFVRNGETKEFRANNDNNTAVKLLFPVPVFAQIVRITCLTGKRVNIIQMRFEILGCKEYERNPGDDTNPSN